MLSENAIIPVEQKQIDFQSDIVLINSIMVNSKSQSYIIVFIIIFYLGLTTIYNVTTPIYEHPDEHAHFDYIRFLKEEKQLPHIINDIDNVSHEIAQPPLYYVIVALGLARQNLNDFDEIASHNPRWVEGGGTNVHFHDSQELFPYEKTTKAVHLGRFMTTLFGVAFLLALWKCSHLVLASRYAWIPVLLLATTPQFLYMSTAISNDVPVDAFCAIALLAMVSIHHIDNHHQYLRHSNELKR